MECPKEHEGLPMVCLYEEGWEQKIRNFLEENQSFILIGPEEELKLLQEVLEKLELIDTDEEVKRAIFSVPIAYLFRSVLLDINSIIIRRNRTKPKPTSGRSSQYSFHWTTVKNKRALVCRIR